MTTMRGCQGVMGTTSVGNDIMPLTDVQYMFTTCTFIVGVLG